MLPTSAFRRPAPSPVSTARGLTRREWLATACGAISCRSPCCPGQCSACRTPASPDSGPLRTGWGNRPESYPAVPARPTREIRAAAAGSPPPRTVPITWGTPFLVTTNQNADPPTSAHVVPPLGTMKTTNDFSLDSSPFPRLLILRPKGFREL